MSSKYDDLSAAELTDFITQCAAAENVLRRERLAAMAEYDRREAWKADGATSMTSWAVGMLGHGRDTATEEVRVARALEELPAIDRAYTDASLSFDQTRAVTRFATPETDEHLASEARKFSAPQLRRMAPIRARHTGGSSRGHRRPRIEHVVGRRQRPAAHQGPAPGG